MSTRTSPLGKVFHRPTKPKETPAINRPNQKVKHHAADTTNQVDISQTLVPQKKLFFKPERSHSIGAQSSISTNYRTKYSLDFSKSLLNEHISTPNSQKAFTNHTSRPGTPLTSRADTPLTTPSTSPRNIRSLTPTTLRLTSPISNSTEFHYHHHHALTTRRETTPLIESGRALDISFGNNNAAPTTPPKNRSRHLSIPDPNFENVPKRSVSNSSVNTRSGIKSSEKKKAVTRHSSPKYSGIDQNTRENLELMRRERELRRMVDEFNLPRWMLSKEQDIAERENIAKQLLARQISTDLKAHEDNQLDRTLKRMQEREAEREEYQQPASDPRAALFSKLDLHSKYPYLKYKVLDHILDTDQLKKSRDELLRRRFRERKNGTLNFPPVMNLDPAANFNEKKLKLQNMYKAVDLTDLKFKKQFDEWFDDELETLVFSKIDYLTKYHSMNFSLDFKRRFRNDIISKSFTEGTKFDPKFDTSILGRNDDEGESAPDDVIQGKKSESPERKSEKKTLNANPALKVFQKASRRASILSIDLGIKDSDPELRKWMMYLRSFRLTEVKPDGSIRYITHHPNQYSQKYWDFLRRRREIEERVEAKKKDRDPRSIFKRIFAKIRAANALKSLSKKEQYLQRSKKKREAQPELVKQMHDAKRDMFAKYHAAYSHLKWDEPTELRYRAARGLTKSVLPASGLGTANAVTTFEFFKYDKNFRKEISKIQENEFEEKRNFYFINSNPYNRKRIQEELDIIDRSTIKKYELDVANQIIGKYNNNKEVLYQRRMKFLNKERWKKEQEYKERKIKLKKEEQIKLAREEHKRFTNHVRTLLHEKEMREHSPEAEDPFLKTDFYQRIKGNYSKVNNLSKIADKNKETRDQIQDMNAAMGKVRSDQRELLAFPEGHKTQSTFHKMHRLYSGGPLLNVSKQTPIQTKVEKELAAVRIQARIRGLIARIRFRRELEMRKLELASKKPKKTPRKQVQPQE